MNKVVYVSDDFLEEYELNFTDYIENYLSMDAEKIMAEIRPNIIESDILFHYKQLKTINDSAYPERDNIKIIYESLKHLTPTQAMDDRIWFAMYHEYFLDDLLYFIKENKNHKNIKAKIESAIFYKHGKQRSLIVQNIARKWWLGYYFYDKKAKNPYHVLDFYTATQDVIGKSTAFLSSNLTNNQEVLLGIVEGIKELTEIGLIKNERKHYVSINKKLNIAGGIVVLDVLSRAEAKMITKDYLSKESKGV